MMPANRDNSIEIPVAEQNDYHVKRLQKIHIKKEKRYENNVSIVVYSKRDFEDMQKAIEKYNYKGLGEMTVIHNPTLLPEVEKKETPKPEVEKKLKAPRKTTKK